MIDDLPRAIADAEAVVDVNLRYPIDRCNDGGDRRQEQIGAEAGQRAATRSTLTFRSWPSIFKVSVEAPSGACPWATAIARVSVAM